MNGACGFPAHRSTSRTLEQEDSPAEADRSRRPPCPVGGISRFRQTLASRLLGPAPLDQGLEFDVSQENSGRRILDDSFRISKSSTHEACVGVDGMEHGHVAICLSPASLRQADASEALPPIRIKLCGLLPA